MFIQDLNSLLMLIAQGKIAAESLHRYVHHGHMETGRNRWEFKSLDTVIF